MREKIKVSEIFYSLQAEGKFVGVPSVFLRTFGCNFTCRGFGMPAGQLSTEADDIAKSIKLYNSFEELPLTKTGCDSYSSWHPKFKHLSLSYTVDEVVEKMLEIVPGKQWVQPTGNDVHLVITGGEPLLGWQRMYGHIFEHPDMGPLKNVTFETNGTQLLTPEFIDHWADKKRHIAFTFSVSPKLSASGEKWEDAIKPEVVAQYEFFGDTYLKFVVETLDHILEAEEAVAAYRKKGFAGKVYLMPVGGVTEVYKENKFSVAREALRRGWQYSPRLHIDLFGNAWGT